MKQITITQLLLFTTWIALAAVFASHFVDYSAYNGEMNDAGDFAYTLLLNQLDLKAVHQIDQEYPIWRSTDPNPPLSARSALAKADQYKRDRLQDTSDWGWALDSLTLSAIDGKTGKWCWCVHFTANHKSGVRQGLPPKLTAYVLMNGRVVGESIPFHDSVIIRNGLIKPEEDATANIDH